MRVLIVVAALVLAGCAGVGVTNPASMSADQLNALAKDKNASLTCSKVVGAGVTATLVLVNVDKASITNGGVTVTADCVVTITTETPAPVPKPVPVPPKP